MLSIAVQAGGQSRRMGENKALKTFLGRPLIQRVIERIEPIADEILITTNQPEDLEFLRLPLFTDIQPGIGALGGLYTAVMSAKYSLVAVVACDMPFVNAPLLVAAASFLIQDGADVGIVETAEGFEPFHAVYRRATCIPAMAAAIQSDQRRVNSWFPMVKLRKLTAVEIQRYDPDGNAFSNVNTPEEFAEAERQANGRSAPGTEHG